MSARRTLLVVSLLFLARCVNEGGGPSIPDPDLTGTEPQVAALLRASREAVVRDPRSALAWGQLGAVHDAHVLTDPAEACYRRAVELAPDEFRWTYLLAIVREINGAEAEELRSLFGRAAELNPDYAPIHVRLGDALWRRGEYEAARVELEIAVSRAPGLAMARRRLGQVILTLGKPEQALEHLTRAIQLEPRDLAAYSGLSQALMRLGRSDEARQVVERSRGLEPVNALDDPVHRQEVAIRGVNSSRAFSMAVAGIRAGAFPEAIENLEIVLNVRPDDASAHYWKGTAHQRLREVEPAMQHLSRALEIEPTLAKAGVQLGQLLADQGRFEESVIRFRSALRFLRDDAEAHDGLGQVLQRMGRIEEARIEYESAVRIAPDHKAASRLAAMDGVAQ